MNRSNFFKANTVVFFAVFHVIAYGSDESHVVWPVKLRGNTAAENHINKIPETKRAVSEEQRERVPHPRLSSSDNYLINSEAAVTVEKKHYNERVSEYFKILTPDRKGISVESISIALQNEKPNPDAQQTILSERKGHIRIQDAIAFAIKWHPVIKRSERELEQSREYIAEAHSSYYPSLTARVKSGFEENQYTGNNDRSNSLVVSANQVIYDFDKTGSKVRLANSLLNRNTHSLDKNINDIIYETANSYLQTIRYLALKDIAHEQTGGFAVINDIAKKRASLGASAESDYSQSKVRLASAMAALHDYEAQAKRWSSVLDSMTNKHISPYLVRQFLWDIGNVCQYSDATQVMSPAIAMANAQIEIAKEQVSAAKAEYFPTISLNPSYEYQLDSYNNSSNHIKKGTWGIFFNISVPIYEGGSKVSRTRQSEEALYASQYNLEQEKTEAMRRINESVSQITGMRESLQAKVIREKEALKTRDLYKIQYIELGSRSFSDLLSAENEIHQTRMDIINSYFSMSTLAMDCLYYSGHLSSYFLDKDGKR